MEIPGVEYLHWAKVIPDCAYSLAASGVPSVSREELGIDLNTIDIRFDTGYGHPELISQIALAYGVKNENVLPLPGASTANYFSFACALGPGDRVLVEWPVYEPIRRIAEIQGLTIDFVERTPPSGYAIPIDVIAQGLKQGARGLFLSNLHNPSGARLTEAELHTAVEMTGAHGAALIIDEVYLDLATRCQGMPATTAAALGDHVMTTNSLTKAYGLGPSRIGWMIAAPEMVERGRRLLDHVLGDSFFVSDAIGIHAFQRLDMLAKRTRSIHDAGHEVFESWLRSRPDIRAYAHHGALFRWLRLSKGIPAAGVCRRLESEYDTVVVSGTFFGVDDHIRVFLARDPDIVAEGLRRLGLVLDDALREGGTCKH